MTYYYHKSVRFLHSLSPSLFSWKPTGKLQQTLASEIHKSGTTLHSGVTSTVKLFPALAGQGRVFICGGDDHLKTIPASIHFVTDTTLCTTLSRDGARVRTVEHLLSALEATGVDNCQIQVLGGGPHEVPLLDGSAKEWVEAIERVGISQAKDHNGNTMDKLAPFLHQTVHVRTNDSFITAIPSPKVQITYGINFPQVEQMYNAGFIQGGSTENAMVCSSKEGWLNPPLRFQDEPCRHKVLDLVGDFSLLAQNGNQGVPVAHIICYKGGHSLHAKFVRHLTRL